MTPYDSFTVLRANETIGVDYRIRVRHDSWMQGYQGNFVYGRAASAASSMTAVCNQ